MKTVQFPSRKSSFRIILLGEFAALILRLLGFTWRFRANEKFKSILENNNPCIFAFWHGQQLFLPFAYSLLGLKKIRKGIYTLISAHPDGRIISHAIKYFGIKTIVGSSSRRGGQALLELIRKAKDGFDIAFTPDGPKGPIFVAKVGAIEAARLSGLPIIPVACGSKNPWKLKSWDQMTIPKPFSTLNFRLGDPIYIPEDTSKDDLEIHAKKLSDVLNALTKEAYELN